MPFAAVLPALVPMIPSIIQGVENIFGAKKGDKKKEAAVDMVSALLLKARQGGLIPETYPNALQVAEMVEILFQDMKNNKRIQEAGKGDVVEQPIFQNVQVGDKQIQVTGTLTLTSK